MTKKYDSYKPSGIEWIGEVPSHWDISKLKNDIRKKITDGPHETPEFLNEGVEFLSVDGIQNDKLVFKGKRYISLEKHIEYQKKAKVEKNDILLGKAASVGKVAIVKDFVDFSIWSPLALIKPRFEKINSYFLFYLFKSNIIEKQINDLSSFNTQQNIAMKDLNKIFYFLPNIKEQQEIVEYLNGKTSSIDNSIETLKSQKEHLIEQKKAIIHKAVTKGLDDSVEMKDSGVDWIKEIPKSWEMNKLKNISFDFYSGGTPTSSNENFYTHKSGIPWVAIGDLTKSEKLTETSKQITKSGLKNKNLRILEKGRIIYSIYATLGKVSILNIDATINQAILSFKNNNKKISKDYIVYYLKYLENFIKLKAKLTIQYNLNSEIVKNYEVITPTITEQNDIVKYLDRKTSKIEEAVNEVEKQINLLEEYKKTLINDVVTGKIKVF